MADAAWQLTSVDEVRAVVTEAISPASARSSQLTAELNEGPIRGSAAFRTVLADLDRAGEAESATVAR